MKIVVVFIGVLGLISSLAFGESKCTNFSGTWDGSCSSKIDFKNLEFIFKNSVSTENIHDHSVFIEQDNCEKIKIDDATWYLDGRTDSFPKHTKNLPIIESISTESKTRSMNWNNDKSAILSIDIKKLLEDAVLKEVLLFEYSFVTVRQGSMRLVDGKLITKSIGTAMPTFSNSEIPIDSRTTWANCTYEKQK